MFDQYFEKFDLAPEVTAALKKCKCIAYAETKEELEEMAYGPTHTSRYDVVYPIEGNGTVKEAEVVRCKNGCVVNFMEDYMRRRDPNSMAIGDDLPSDKPRFKDRFGYEFSSLRQETLDWLSTQQVIMLPFSAGPRGHGYPSLMICPLNAAFFALSLANMQGFTSIVDVPEHYKPRAIIFVAPPFRHTHFDGKQVVVHNRSKEMHEVWAYNLYPGPSAKKGVFSLLLDIGEQEGWVCCHTSAAMVETPYECEVVFMHEGASGGGKSEMLEDFHREEDDRLLIGTHTVTGEKYYMTLGESCKIHPIADDMACALKSFQDPESGKLRILDAEDGWFLRMDGMNAYGNSPLYERICIHPSEPLVFFNMDGVPGATCLIWEHVIESNGKPCSNPRVILPRKKQIELIMNNYDAIQVKKYYLDTSVYNRYCKSHYKNDIDLAKEAISLYYPDYIETYEDIIENCNVTTVCNMLTLRKKNFDLYCAWLFKILFYVEAHTNLEDRDAYQKRAYGFLSERLQNVWMKKNNLKIKEVPMFFYEDNKIKSFLKTAKNIFK